MKHVCDRYQQTLFRQTDLLGDGLFRILWYMKREDTQTVYKSRQFTDKAVNFYRFE